jgi:hypothetical protein
MDLTANGRYDLSFGGLVIYPLAMIPRSPQLIFVSLGPNAQGETDRIVGRRVATVTERAGLVSFSQ